ASTRVVLPWSTWAMMAILRMSSRRMGFRVRSSQAKKGGEVYQSAPARGSMLLRRHRRNMSRRAFHVKRRPTAGEDRRRFHHQRGAFPGRITDQQNVGFVLVLNLSSGRTRRNSG